MDQTVQCDVGYAPASWTCTLVLYSFDGTVLRDGQHSGLSSDVSGDRSEESASHRLTDTV